MVRYTCSECSATFPTRQRYERHLTSHSTERRHQCHQCGKAFKLKQNLVCHERLHSADFYHCEVCGAAFKQREGLSRHAKSHDIPGRHQCEICGRVYVHPALLARHRRRQHEAVEACRCTECGRNFKYSVSLRKHILRVHTGKANIFTCSTCGKDFKHKNTLVRHMQKSHQLSPTEIRQAVPNEPEVTSSKTKQPEMTSRDQSETVRQKVIFISPIDPSILVNHRKIRLDSESDSRLVANNVMTSADDVMTSRLRSDSVCTDIETLRNVTQEESTLADTIHVTTSRLSGDVMTSLGEDGDDVVTSLGAVEIVTSSVFEGPWRAGHSPPKEIFNESDVNSEDEVTDDDAF